MEVKYVPMSAEYIDHMGSDLSVVNAARVSFSKESFWKEHEEGCLLDKDKKLINYLAKHKHFSPFNHTFLSIRIKVPIFVARQLVKHEYMPWNEVSRRYVDSPPEFYLPPTFRERAENVKQGSGKKDLSNKYALFEFGRAGKPLEFQTGVDTTVRELYEKSTERAYRDYLALVYAGVCPEQCRIVLPHSLMTEVIWSGTLKAVAKMLQLRLGEGTQEETAEFAKVVRDIVEPLFPVSVPALLEASL